MFQVGDSILIIYSLEKMNKKYEEEVQIKGELEDKNIYIPLVTERHVVGSVI